MSKAKFDKAAAIVQSLPKEGPIQPTQEEQLFVRPFSLLRRVASERVTNAPLPPLSPTRPPSLRAVLQVLQAGLVDAAAVLSII